MIRSENPTFNHIVKKLQLILLDQTSQNRELAIQCFLILSIIG